MEEKKIDHNAWMVTFSDLIMLLLTFFVMLLTMSSMDKKKLREAFIKIGGQAAGILELTSSRSVDNLNKFIKKHRETDSMLVINHNLITDLLTPTDESKKNLENAIGDIEKLIDIMDDERGIVISFQDNILFYPGTATLRKEAFPVLDSIAVAISECPNDMVIMGHTDSTPTNTKEYKSNWELSSDRGLTVLDYFLEAKELPPYRFSVGGYGASRPKYSNNKPENRALNRRVEIIFKHV